MSVSPKHLKQSTESMQTLSKSQQHFTETEEQKNPEICMEPQRAPNSQSNPEG